MVKKPMHYSTNSNKRPFLAISAFAKRVLALKHSARNKAGKVLSIGLLLYHLQPSAMAQEISTDDQAQDLLAYTDTALFQKSKFAAALKNYERIASYYQQQQDSLPYLVAQLNYAKCLLNTGASREAFQWANSLAPVLRQYPEQQNETYLRAIRDVGVIYLTLQTDHQRSEYFFNKAKELNAEMNLLAPEEEARNYANLAGSQYYQSKFRKAVANYGIARQMAANDSTIARSTYIQILLGESIASGDLGLYSQALSSLDELLEIFRASGNVAFEGWVLSAMSRIYGFQGAHHKTADYASRAIRLYESLGQANSPTVIQSRHHLAEAMVSFKDFDRAIKEFHKNLKIETERYGTPLWHDQSP